MTGYLARNVTATYTYPTGKATATIPAGTLVAVSHVSDLTGTCQIRKLGTLLTQRVRLADVIPS